MSQQIHGSSFLFLLIIFAELRVRNRRRTEEGTSPPADSDPLKWEASSKECRANVSSQARPSFHVGHDLVRPAVVVVYINDSWVVEKVRAADMAWGEAAGLLSV